MQELVAILVWPTVIAVMAVTFVITVTATGDTVAETQPVAPDH